MELVATDLALPRRAFELRASLTLGPETVALVGPSGAGKTSLLKALAGLELPATGRIALAGETWFDAVAGTDLPPERRRVAYLPQDYGLFPHLTVAGNLRFAARRPRPDLLERFGISHLAAARPQQLSGGERQRVALARALARDPEPLLLLLDEPFGALDTVTRAQVRDELRGVLAELRLPTLLVTHSFEDAVVLADRVGVIDRGQIVQLDTPEQVERHPASALVARLTGANVIGAVAVHPWRLQLTDPAGAWLTARVLEVRRHAGRVVVRTDLAVVHLPDDGRSVPEVGVVVGLCADHEARVSLD